MAKSNIITFPKRACAVDEDNALWLVAVAACFKDTFSIEHKYERQQWEIQIKSNTFQGADAMVKCCRHALGWDRTKATDAKSD